MIKRKLKIKTIVTFFFICLIIFNNSSVFANEEVITNEELQMISEDSTENSVETLTENDLIPLININSLFIEGNNHVGRSHAITADVEGGEELLYRFYIMDRTTKKWTMLRDYDESNTVDWTPTKVGNYFYEVQVKDKYSSNSVDSYLTNSISIELPPPTTINNLTVQGDKHVGGKHTITADTEESNNVLYRFYVMDRGTKKWTMLRDYSESNTVNWIPIKEGDYFYEVQIKDKYSNKSVDNYLTESISIVSPPLAVVNNLTIQGDNHAGKRQTITANAEANNDVLYRFYVMDRSTKKWTMLKNYSESNTINWLPTKSGDYFYEVQVKDQYSNKSVDSYLTKSITIMSPPPAVVNNLTIQGDNQVGKRQTITANGQSENGVLYRFYVMDRNTKKWTMLRSYSESNTVSWLPTKSGDYLYEVQVKDKYSINSVDQYVTKTIGILPSKTIMLDPGHEGKYPLDPGAVGNGLYEYQLNNSLTKMIASKLESQGYNVIYTRNPNIEGPAPLKERDEKVNSLMPDLLISIHHDSSVNRSAGGYSIFWSSYRYRIDKSGIVVTENGVDYPFVDQKKRMVNGSEETYIVYKKNGKNVEKNINDSDGVITVRDRTLSTVAKESQKFANILHSKLQTLDYINPRPSPVNNNNIYIIRETNVPTILFEAGFISNPTEAQKIKDTSNQNKFATKVVEAINAYFK